MNSSRGKELACVLRELADYVENCRDEQLAPIFAKASALLRREAADRRTPKSPVSESELREIEAQLQTLPSRDAADTLLQKRVPNRNSLEALARFLNLPVQKDDSVERLRAKVVENTVGSRLRSKAIQG